MGRDDWLDITGAIDDVAQRLAFGNPRAETPVRLRKRCAI